MLFTANCYFQLLLYRPGRLDLSTTPEHQEGIEGVFDIPIWQPWLGREESVGRPAGFSEEDVIFVIQAAGAEGQAGGSGRQKVGRGPVC
jgi:hypothetical protein